MRAGRPSLPIAGRELPAFRVLGVTGFVAAVVLALALADARGLDAGVELAVIAAAVATFLGLALATKAITGREMLIYYHHEIAVLTVAGLVTWALGAPVLRHLDATTLGLGAFLFFGRLGCLRAACCHGRPSGRGIVYGDEHRRIGFPAYLVGVPLVPVQAIEAAVVAVLVVAGVAVAGGEPGTAFGLYVVGYALARFTLELFRGDALRRYWRGLSEAQWTSLAIASGTAVAAVAGALPHPLPHVLAAVALALAAPFAARRRDAGVLDPGQVHELARALPRPRPGPIRIAETSAGLQMSAGMAGTRAHYTLSRRPTPLGAPEAESLAQLIVSLRHPGASAEVVEGAAGAYHVVLDPADPAP
jgi:Prolipoprotein diacylglyceryl transferase